MWLFNVGKMKSKGDVKGLIKALNYRKDAYIREAAAKALGEIGDARAIEPLIDALKDESEYVRSAAAEALDKLGWQPDTEERKAAYWAAKQEWDKCVEIGAPAVEPLIIALKDWRVREAAAEALGKIGAPAVEPLIDALRDKSEDVRKAAAEALGEIGDVRAVEPLIAALKDKDDDVREAAAEALVKIGAPAVEPLIDALKDKNWRVRGTAAWALVKIYHSGCLSMEQKRMIEEHLRWVVD